MLLGVPLNRLAVPVLVMLILAMMVLPLPTIMLDVLFTLNIALSMIVLLVSLNARRPLDFSVFPTVLLLTTLFRLALNVASTRIILLQGHTGPEAAGKVIESFGNFLVGGNYTVGAGVWGINANTAYPNTPGADSYIWWNADAFGDDQYAQGVITRLAGGSWAGLCARATASYTYYFYYTDGAQGYFARYLGSTSNYVELAFDSEAWAVSDVMRLEAEGTTLRVKRNGTTLHSVINSDIASGSAGVAGYGGYTVGSSIDDLEFGNLGGGGAAASIVLPSFRMPFAILAR